MKWIKKLAVICLVLAAILFAAGFALDGQKELKTINKDIDSIDLLGILDTDKEFKADFHEIYANVDALNLDMDAGKVIIKQYDEDYVRVEADSRRRDIKVRQEQGTLTIKNSVNWNIFHHNSGTMIIYLPRNIKLKEANFNIDAAFVEIDSIDSAILNVEVDAGNFHGKKIMAHKSMLDVDAGSIKIDSIDSYHTEMECDAGSIKAGLTGKESEYCFMVEKDLGKISVNGKNNAFSKQGHRQIKADCDVGKIEITTEELK